MTAFTLRPGCTFISDRADRAIVPGASGSAADPASSRTP
jgi:hypothetical protein